MPSIISGLLRKATRKDNDQLNIFTYPTHESYQSCLAECGHNWYLFHAQGIKQWDKKYRPVPNNHTLFNSSLGPNQIPIEVDFDIVLSQNRFAHYNISKDISKNLNIPLVSLEHCIMNDKWNPAAIEQAKKMRGDIEVYISDYSLQNWGVVNDDRCKVIYHGIDTNLFQFAEKERATPILYVCNKLFERPYEVGGEEWNWANKHFPNKCKLVGDNEPYTKAPATPKDLVAEYQNAKIYLNVARWSTYSTACLEAAACGATIVSVNSCAIPDIFTHGHDALLFNTEEEMVSAVNTLLNDEAMRKELATNALETIKTKFSMERFVSQWNEVLNEAANL